jgi:membrane protease YdiL (CAAX protease family)
MTRNSFWLFLLVSFGIASPLFYFSTQQTSAVVITLLFLAGSYAPAFGAWLAISLAHPDEKQAFLASLRRQSGRRWILFGLLVPTLIWLAALPVVLLVNYGEEIGWRGYALPFLLKRFSPLTASLLLSAIWILFHVPLYVARPVFGSLASVSILLISLILTWMYLNTKSILPGTLFHAAFNAWAQVFAGGTNAPLLLVIVIAFLAIIVIWLFNRFGRNLSVETVSLS